MAKLGTGVLVVPQKPWHLVEEETAIYRATYREAHGEEPPSPIVAGWTYVDDNADRAEEQARTWLTRLLGLGHHRTTSSTSRTSSRRPGYEFHGQMYDRLTAPGGLEKMTEFYIGLQPWGTPEQVYEKTRTFCDLVGGDSYIGVFRFGGMPPAEAEQSMRLFAKEVMPELQKISPAIERLAHIRG